VDTATLRQAPVILGLDDDAGSLGILERELSKRYGQDYEVLCEVSPAAAVRTLTRLRAEDRTVALVLAAQRMAEIEGVESADAAGDEHPRRLRGRGRPRAIREARGLRRRCGRHRHPVAARLSRPGVSGYARIGTKETT
jgi:hypothetical protein